MMKENDVNKRMILKVEGSLLQLQKKAEKFSVVVSKLVSMRKNFSTLDTFRPLFIMTRKEFCPLALSCSEGEIMKRKRKKRKRKEDEKLSCKHAHSCI